MLHIGFNHYINKEEIESILDNETIGRHLKDILKKLEAEGKVIKLTKGKAAKTIIIMKTGRIYLSAIESRTISKRFNMHFLGGGEDENK